MDVIHERDNDLSMSEDTDRAGKVTVIDESLNGKGKQVLEDTTMADPTPLKHYALPKTATANP